MICTKRPFASVSGAKRAHRHAPYRIRVYRCDQCLDTYHVTNADKRPVLGPWRPEAAFRGDVVPSRQLAPARTLAEVEAIAAQIRKRMTA